ncbi:glycosyltransferase family 4 protein [Jonesia quinghaiensis]|uniref:glycosyltransferase family 4 protein n=1 Tax=Jonesia quinghaiensis TaxID=262806 RepID=UPI00048B15D6|nr:glycosyltransferase family 4 protein [Jonesia quinghaiensis]
MRIVQLLGSSAGGVARHVHQITGGLVAQGNDVLVACPSGLESQFSEYRHTPVEITDRPRGADLVAISHIRRLADGTDIIHAHGLRAGALAALALCMNRRVRLVVTLHNLPVGSRAVRGVSRVLESIVARRADAVLGVSLDIVARMAERGARDPQRALVPAPPMAGAASTHHIEAAAQLRAEFSIADDCPVLVTVARLAPQKGLDTLVSAAEHLVAQGAHVRWLVVGDGPLHRSTQDSVTAAEVPVTMVGRRSDVSTFFLGADVVVQTPVWEGQPIAIQEALRLGAAIVSTNAGGTAEVTDDAAALVPVGDGAAVASEVARLLGDPQAVEELRQRARERSAQLPTLCDVTDQLLAVYCA